MYIYGNVCTYMAMHKYTSDVYIHIYIYIYICDISDYTYII